MNLKVRLVRAGLVLSVVAGLLAIPIWSAAQVNQPGGGWWYDPGRHGMQDLRTLKPIEGCNVPGGLQRITSSDEPGQSAQFWCGPPPYCLTDAALPGSWNCTVVPFSRREPRGDPSGTPSANPVRDPDDLRCVNTGLPPISGRCPMPPSVSATFNGQATGTSVQVGQNVVLAISSPHAEQLRMTCTGANFGYSPFNLTNLDSYADTTHSFAPQAVLNSGTTSCTLTATNARGSASATASFVAQNPPPAPTVRATFDPTAPTAGGRVELETRTTNATSLRWSCTGRWTNSNTSRGTGTVRSGHNVSGSPGTANCTFTATGPGGTATASASWTSVSGGTGGSGGGPIPILDGCTSQAISWVDPCPACGENAYTTCYATTGARSEGWRGTINPSTISVPSLSLYRGGWIELSCQGGTYVVHRRACWAAEPGG